MAVLKATKRQKTGTRQVKHLRKQGQVPAIIYGHGLEPAAVALGLGELTLAVRHGERLLELDLDGKTENVLIKDVQYDHMQQDILHVDLARVNLDERVRVTVAILLRGVPAGATEGGVLSQVRNEAEIDCAVVAIPEDLRVSVAAMKIGDVLHMKDLPLPEGIKLVSDPETIVCTVSLVAEEAAAPAAAEGAAAEPELVRERKPDEDAAEGDEKKS